MSAYQSLKIWIFFLLQVESWATNNFFEDLIFWENCQAIINEAAPDVLKLIFHKPSSFAKGGNRDSLVFESLFFDCNKCHSGRER